MRLKIIQASLAAILAALLVASGSFARLRYTQAPQQELTVSAAISLKDALDKVERLKPKFVLGNDVRQVLTYVSTGNADAGIVYATDAKTTDQVTVVADRAGVDEQQPSLGR